MNSEDFDPENDYDIKDYINELYGITGRAGTTTHLTVNVPIPDTFVGRHVAGSSYNPDLNNVTFKKALKNVIHPSDSSF